jgi:hypothetical protein
MKGFSWKALIITVSLMTITACSTGPRYLSVRDADLHKLSSPVDTAASTNPYAGYAVLPRPGWPFANADTGELFEWKDVFYADPGNGSMLLEPGEYIFGAYHSQLFVVRKNPSEAEIIALMAGPSALTPRGFYKRDIWNGSTTTSIVAVEQVIYVKARLEAGKWYAVQRETGDCDHVQIDMGCTPCKYGNRIRVRGPEDCLNHISVLELDPNRFEVLNGGRTIDDLESGAEYREVDERHFYMREIARSEPICEKEKCFSLEEVEMFAKPSQLWNFD